MTQNSEVWKNTLLSWIFLCAYYDIHQGAFLSGAWIAFPSRAFISSTCSQFIKERIYAALKDIVSTVSLRCAHTQHGDGSSKTGRRERSLTAVLYRVKSTHGQLHPRSQCMPLHKFKSTGTLLTNTVAHIQGRQRADCSTFLSSIFSPLHLEDDFLKFKKTAYLLNDCLFPRQDMHGAYSAQDCILSRSFWHDSFIEAVLRLQNTQH